MAEELQNPIASRSLDLKVKRKDEDRMTSEFEHEGNTVLAIEGLLDVEESGMSRTGSHGAKRHKSELVTLSSTKTKDVAAKENKLNRQDSTKSVTLFRRALISCDWELAESMISEADPPTLSDFLCLLLNSVWLLWKEPDYDQIEELIEMILSNGFCDFRKAAISTSRLVSFFLGCHCVNLDETVTVLDQSVQVLSELALDFIDFHSRLYGNKDRENHNATLDVKLRLNVFEMFLYLAGDDLTGKDFTEAFEAACYPLVRFSSLFYPGWSYGTAGIVIMDFLCTLVEGGAENVDKCFILAVCFGSCELVRALLEAAVKNEVELDVDLALDLAAYHRNIDNMELLVFVAESAVGTFVRAAARGSLSVVQWFVERGCTEAEICVALSAATSASHVDVAAFLLPLLPHHLLSILGIDILEYAGKSKGSIQGVDFLLHSNFMGDPVATYAVADHIARSEDSTVVPELKSFLLQNWSKKAYRQGLELGKKHFVNMIRVFKRGESPLVLRNLPVALRVAIAYMQVYRESVDKGGCLLSQRSRGQLVDAVWRMGNELLDKMHQSEELVAAMEHHLRPFL